MKPVHQQDELVESAIPEILSGTVPSVEFFGELTTRADHRGDLTEIYRRTWPGAPALTQWNHVRNVANSMRGMHVHMQHSDFIVVIEGDMLLALRDIREVGSGAAGIVRLRGDRLSWAFVPPGVIHGFYSPNGNTLVYGLTHSWHTGDEFCCRWDDPEMGIEWPSITDPAISPRDAAAGTFRELVDAWESSRAQ